MFAKSSLAGMMKKSTNDRSFTLRMSARTLKELEKVSADEDRSLAATVRVAIELYLASRPKSKKPRR